MVGGRYRLDQPIGRGHAEIVWLAFDTQLYRTVAVKRLHVQSGLAPAEAERARAQALQEGRDATRVAHPGAIKVHDVFRDGDNVWLVMEFVPSRTMADFLEQHGLLTADQAAFLGVQLGRALGAAHSTGIVHRALEPRNVLLADDGGVKMTDVGISGGADPAFRAPEVNRGGPARPASDVFSLGATLYAAVEGVPPFGPNGTGELRQPQKAGPLTGALLKLLRLDPAMRPTLHDTVNSLAAITTGQQTAFIPPTAPSLPTVPAGRPVPPPTQVGTPHGSARSLSAGTALLRRPWLIPALAVVAAVVIGALIAELLFV
jgi:serine/threonine protein kinase